MNAKPEHVISFLPFAKTGLNETDIRSAGFIDDTHAYTFGSTGELAVWEIATAKELWHCTLDERSPLVLSAGGKYIFSVNEGDVVCFDALSGKVLGVMTGGVPVRGNLDVTPDGAWLVGSSGPVVTIFDLKTGKNTGDVGLPIGTNGGKVVALPDGFALVGPVLFDLAKRMPVWQYEGGEEPFAVGGRCWTFLGEKKQSALVNARLPQDTARKADAKLDATSAFALKPGDKVSLDVAVTTTPEDTKAINEHMSAEIQRAGFAIDPAANVHVVVRTEDGKTVTQRWNHFAAGPFSSGGEDVSVTEKIVRATINVADKPAWESRDVHQLGMVGRKNGQSIGQAVAEQNVYDIDFLKRASLPNYVLRPEATTGLGQSKWMLGGVKDGK